MIDYYMLGPYPMRTGPPACCPVQHAAMRTGPPACSLERDREQFICVQLLTRCCDVMIAPTAVTMHCTPVTPLRFNAHAVRYV